MTLREHTRNQFRRIITEPPWSTREPEPGELILRGRTKTGPWGFGQHPSTSLCLSLLCGLLGEYGPDVHNVVEFCCGSGLLTIAAGCLGANRSFGIEPDPELRAIANENQALSQHLRGWMPRCAQLGFVATPEAAEGVPFSCADHRDPGRPAVELVIANLTAPELHAQADLLAKLAAQGHLLIAGFVEEEREAVEQAFVARGFRLLYREVREGFFATVLKARAADEHATA